MKKFLNNLVKPFAGKDDGWDILRYLVLVLGFGCIFLKIFTVLGHYAAIMGIISPRVSDMSVLAASVLVMALLGGWAGGVVFMSDGQPKQGAK